MNEEQYLVQVQKSNHHWDTLVAGRFTYTAEESEAKALSQAEALLHNKSQKFSGLNFRIVQVKVIAFVPGKGVNCG
jgi:hypothetical protein